MREHVRSVFVCCILVISMFVILDISTDFVEKVEGGNILYVNKTGSGGAYTSIQTAINAADDYDTVFVFNGIYYENIVIDNNLLLKGEDKYGVILNGSAYDFTMSIHGSNNKIKGITIENGNGSYAGISLPYGNNIIEDNILRNNNNGITISTGGGNVIKSNIFMNNEFGIFLVDAMKQNITNNIILDNEIGVAVFDTSAQNVIQYNNISNNSNWGIYFSDSFNNDIHHNNLMNNTNQIMQMNSNNIWNDGYGRGNYWSDYTGLDDGSGGREAGDGVGDTDLPHWSADNYPLMDPADIIAPITGPVYNQDLDLYYDTIQEAINDADPFNSIFVSNGTYFEDLNINKPLNITGENPYGTVIVGDYIGNAVTITSDWVKFSGFKVLNSGDDTLDAGIKLEYAQNCNISDNEISNCEKGIVLYYSDNNLIYDNNASSNEDYGILIHKSHYNNITNNIASKITLGIYLYRSSENNIDNNRVFQNNYYGIRLIESTNNNINNNIVFSNTKHGIYLYMDSIGNIISNNTVHSNMENGIEISSNSYYNEIKDNIVFSNDENGINIVSPDNKINSNQIYKNKENGIYISYKNHIVKYNYLHSNDGNGIRLVGMYCNISGNTFINDSIYLSGSNRDTWTSHYIDTLNTVNGKPIYYIKNQTGGIVPEGAGQIILANCMEMEIRNQELENGSVGLILGYSNYNLIIENHLSNNEIGIWGANSYYNSFIRNTISENQEYGFYFYSSSYNKYVNNEISMNNGTGIYLGFNTYQNKIYHNTLTYNENQATDITHNNYWDLGYPYGGNYWSDYQGYDLNTTSSQDVPPNDGIGDIPYLFGSGSKDSYPLMEPYYDTRKSQISLIQPANNSAILNGTILEFDIFEEDIICVSYCQINNETAISLSEPYKIYTDDWIEGNYTIRINTTDYAGNQNSSVYSIKIDKTKPKIYLINPNNNTIVAPYEILKFSIGEEHLADVTYCINSAGDNSFEYPYEIPLKDLPGGDYNITINATDEAGNRISNYFIFTIDTTPPTIIYDSALNHSTIYVGKPIQIEFTVNETRNVTYSYEDGIFNTLESPYMINTSTWDDGKYLITVRATDIFENMAEIWFEVIIDAIPPYVIKTHPENNSWGLKLDDAIFFTFSEMMDTYYVEKHISTDPYVRYNWEWDSNRTTLTIRFYETYLDEETDYVLTIDSAISDASGNTMASDYLYNFSTRTHKVDTDGDGIPNSEDPDDDNDGYTDENDAFPVNPDEWLDTDSDGIGNNADNDDDNDGHQDTKDAYPLDPKKWSESEDILTYILLMIIIALGILLIFFSFFYKWGGKKENEKTDSMEVVDERIN